MLRSRGRIISFHRLCVAPDCTLYSLRFGLAFQPSRLIPRFNDGRFLPSIVSAPSIVGVAVSAVVAMTGTTINDVCGGKAKVRVKEEDARITLTLPATCEEEEAIQTVLAGMMLYLCSLRDEYPDYIEVLEV